MNQDYSPTSAPSLRTPGLRSCLAAGWRDFASHPVRGLVGRLPSLAVSGLGFVLAVGVLTHLYIKLIAPVRTALFLGISATKAWSVAIPSATDIIMGAGAILIALLTARVSSAAAWRTAIDAAATDAPKRRSLRERMKAWWQAMRRLVVYDTMVTGLLLPPALIIGAVAWWVWTPALWALLPWWIYCSIVFLPGRVSYLSQDIRLGVALRHTLREGHRHAGGYLLLTMLSAIPAGLLALALLLPAVLFPLAAAADAGSQLMGAESGLPPEFHIVAIAVIWVAYIGASHLLGLYRLPVVLKVRNS